MTPAESDEITDVAESELDEILQMIREKRYPPPPSPEMAALLAQIIEKKMSLSLWNIEQTLQDLADARESAEDAGDAEALKVIDSEIAAYLTKETAKIESYACLIRSKQTEANVLANEASRLLERSRRMNADVARLKENALVAMQAFNVTEFKTPSNTMRRQKNGGLQALEVDKFGDGSPDVDEDFFDVVVVIPIKEWARIVDVGKIGAASHIIVKRVISEDRLRDALALGPVAGARLRERGEHVRVL
jgi:Siphovirus Gp157